MGKTQDYSSLFKILTENIFDGLIEFDQSGRVLVWNKSAERITGYTSQQMVGQSFREIFAAPAKLPSESTIEASSLIAKTLADGVAREGMVSLKHSEGYSIKVLARSIAILDEKGGITGLLKIITDNKALIALHQQNKKTDETVLLDFVTGIGNRAHIESKIRFALDDLHTSGTSIGILFIDIDKFKDFNDTYGHMVGDKVLRFVAKTLRQNLRNSDSCGRWGGEEFVALVLDSNLEGLGKIAEKLRFLMETAQISEDGRDLHATISIGATQAREEDTLVNLLERADKFMYQSKQEGRNRVTLG